MQKPVLEVAGCDDPLLRAAFISAKQVKIKGGKARIRVSCRRVQACNGTLELKSTRAVQTSRKSHHKSKITYGRGKIKIPSRKSATVTIKISKKGMQAIKIAGRTRASVSATINGARQTSTRLTLVAP